MAINFPTATIIGQEFTDDNRVIWEVISLSPTRWGRKVLTTSLGTPSDGVADDVLTKQSTVDFDTIWQPASPGQPPSGATGEALTKQSASDYDSDWEAVPNELPVGGVSDELLSKINGVDFNLDWKPDAGGLPSGTTAIFLQATAPAGWGQSTTNNRMLRVVNSTGGGTAGSHNPIENNKTPSHTHGKTVTPGGGSHTHGPGAGAHFWCSQSSVNGLLDLGASFNQDNSPSRYTTYAGAHTHGVSVTTNGVGTGTWQPRYVNVIECVKS